MRTPLKTFTSMLFVVALLVTASFAQKRARFEQQPAPAVEQDFSSQPMAAPVPVLVTDPKNPSCADINAIPNSQYGGAFSHMTSNWERKFDPPGSGNQSGNLASGLQGGMPANANLSINYNINPASTMNGWSLTWTNVAFVDRLVSAVIMKGANDGAYVYTYPALSAGDVGQFTLPSGTQAISHISFCFEQTTAPSAAPAYVAGRVTDAYGRGISAARVTVFNGTTGESFSVATNTFGYYKIEDLEVGNFYIMNVAHRRYSFVSGSTSFTLNSDLTGMNFSASN